MVNAVSIIIKKKEVIMPRGDRTGPYGEGPKTGRQMGFCVGNEQPGFAYQNEYRGIGFGRQFRGGFGPGRGSVGLGRVAGFGFRHGQERFFMGRSAEVSEKTLIDNEIRILKDQLSALEERLSKIAKDE